MYRPGNVPWEIMQIRSREEIYYPVEYSLNRVKEFIKENSILLDSKVCSLERRARKLKVVPKVVLCEREINYSSPS